jgi:8-oxo-dGTP pyrophosphatase MutT (NUDIX family)
MDERWKPSVTVAAIIEREIDGQRRFLLVEENTPEGLRLNNPAGHLEPGESPEQAVAREALEETGCVFTPQAVVGIYMSRFHRVATHEDVTYVRFAYCGQVSDPQPGWVLDHGIVRTLWLTADEIRANAHRLRSPLVLRCLEDLLAGRRYPLEVVTVDPTVFSPEIKAATTRSASS